MVGPAGSPTCTVYADVTLTRSKVKVNVTGLLNFRQLAKPCMLAAMTAAPLRGFLVTGQMLFLTCNQQCQNTEGNNQSTKKRNTLQPYYCMGDGGGGHWLVQMEWRPAGWSVFLPLLIFPCTIKSRSSLLAPAHSGGPRKRAEKRSWLLLCVT